VGRGTERPFEWIGAPWLNATEFAKRLNEKRLPGVRFLATTRTPSSSTHKGLVSPGVDILVDDWTALRAVRVGITIALTLQELHPNDWKITRYDTLLIHQQTAKAIADQQPWSAIEASWTAGLQQYRERRAKVLIYEE
jgi:uncharacterized protein YbbC (DUF1343 family)